VRNGAPTIARNSREAKKYAVADPDRDDAPTTPPVAIRPEHAVGPVSGMRTDVPVSDPTNDTQLSMTEPSGRNPDTLMSLPKPALHDELPFEARLRQLEDRLEAFESRLTLAERARESANPARATPWWFWLVFMLGLAVTWSVLGALR
jgi:hypothetical protein